ncbi:hypothetical protein F1559_002317 [Cyanidiococcus yangmingshanensis]|uniref:Thiaminase-2/PQQC domain-containing protein n=1 Tax=Cyanidiococcus yangmingshanensis TaxID=2690220 RepID=A0A7J7IEH2_9RHOD|nr:hypothetical protein F1559_002317 [Cyanidiococcus yangmingshanensis]
MVRVSARLWERNVATVAQVLQTEWLTEIARGTLDTVRIEQFLAVDEKFLASYWRCLGLLCYTAETEWERALLSGQSQAIFAELDSIGALRRAAQKPTRAWPLSETASNETETTLSVNEWRSLPVSQGLLEACDGYLRLLFDASRALLGALAHASSSANSLENASFSSSAPWRRERMLLVAALVPCMSLYAYLGRTLASAQTILEADAPVNAVCKEWVETYRSADFQQRSERLEQLLDSCFEEWCSATGDAEDEVVTLLDTLAYAPAMRFEKALFEAANQLEGSSALSR